MVKIKHLAFVFSCFFGSASCMLFHQYDRSVGMPVWEQNRLNALAVLYDGPNSVVGRDLVVGVPGYFYRAGSSAQQLVQRFVSCIRTGRVEYPTGVGGDPMRRILLIHAQNLIGRELMYRIIAKLEPRIECVDSVSAIIDNMDPAVSGGFANSVNICANFLVAIRLVRNDNVNHFMADLKGFKDRAINTFNGLFSNPVVFVSNNAFQCADGSSVVDQFSSAKLGAVKGILEVCLHRLRAEVNRVRFRLIYNPNSEDQYNPGDNAITITGKVSNYNLITGPILRNALERTYVETKWQKLQPVSPMTQQQLGVSSILKHELGHYLRVGLEKFISDPAFLNVRPALFATGVVSSEYMTHLADIWDDTEELAEIFGVLFFNGNILRDRLNQSEYNLAANPLDGVRYSHRCSRFPLVPYKFFNEVFGIGRGGRLPISDQTVVYYNKAVANI